MKKKNLLIAAAIVYAAALIALFVISYKVALAVIFGSCFIALMFAIIYANKNAWEDLEKQDPNLAKKMWQHALNEFDRIKLIY